MLYRFYVGLIEKDGRTPVAASRMKLCAQLLTEHFGGCTVLQASGYWGELEEPSMVLEVISERPRAATFMDSLTLQLETLANQEYVLRVGIPTA